MLRSNITKTEADSETYALVSCQLVDINGIPVATASNEVEFSVTGGEFYGSDNGCPRDSTNMRSPTRNAFCGKAFCVARPGEDVGFMKITARLVDKPQVSTTIAVAVG